MKKNKAAQDLMQQVLNDHFTDTNFYTWAALQREDMLKFSEELIEQVKIELYASCKEWLDANEEKMQQDRFWQGYDQGMIDAMCEIRIFGTDLK